MTDEETKEPEQEQEQDALTMVAHKALDIFLELFNSLKEHGYDDAEAKEVALALTPKPVEILTAIYTGSFNEEVMDAEIEEFEPVLDDSGGIPDDEILKQYRGGPDGKSGEGTDN
jgi:hypothetical protein